MRVDEVRLKAFLCFAAVGLNYNDRYDYSSSGWGGG